jgi:hypothetical protein
MQAPRINLIYNGIRVDHKNLYKNDFVIESIDYTDRRTGEADDIDMQLSSLNGKWKADLLPQEGDTIKVEFISGTNKLVTPECYVDAVIWSDPDYSCNLQGLSHLYKKKSELYKKKDLYYNDTTLRTLISSIAQRNKLGLIWIGTDQTIEETYQRKQSDYSFVKSLSKEFGAFFKIYNKKLIWASSTDNYVFDQTGETVTAQTGSGQRYLEIHPRHLKTLEVSLKANKKTKVTWESIDTFNKKINKVAGKKSNDLDLGPVLADKLAIKTKVNNKAVGSTANDYLNGNLEIKANLGISDIPEIKANELLSGSIIYLVDQGSLTGTYVITSITHTIAATQGWSASFEASRLTSKELPKDKPVAKYNRTLLEKEIRKSLEGSSKSALSQLQATIKDYETKPTSNPKKVSLADALK